MEGRRKQICGRNQINGISSCQKKNHARDGSERDAPFSLCVSREDVSNRLLLLLFVERRLRGG